MVMTHMEFKDTYVELQAIVANYKLTTYTHIDQLLPVVVHICKQPRGTLMSTTEWERFYAIVQLIHGYKCSHTCE